jgi:predicted RNA-binding protein with PUA-like domain
MADFLLKTEPSDYSFDDLVREKQTVWTGVKNPTAIRHLLSTKKGDRLVIYHTGDVKAAVGLATVVSADTDPKSPTFPHVVIAAGRRLASPVTLAAIKAITLFADSPLVRIGRLSVVPLTAAQYQYIASG